MPNPNVRYPLAAIPESIFDALQRDMVKDHDNPYAIVSVNEYVQSMLNHVPMYDYLLRMVNVSHQGAETRTGLVGDPTIQAGNLKMNLKKVRVTESQFEMLSQRQAQYARDGLRIPISCIMSSMLYQWSKSVRKALIYRNEQNLSLPRESRPEAWMYGDVNGSRCRLNFFEKDGNGEWQSLYWTSECDLVTPGVIVGWNPRRRALRGANLCNPEDEN
jgi:hypothetical protein